MRTEQEEKEMRQRKGREKVVEKYKYKGTMVRGMCSREMGKGKVDAGLVTCRERTEDCRVVGYVVNSCD